MVKGDVHEPSCPLLFRPFYQASFSIKKGVVEHFSRQIHGHFPRRGVVKIECMDETLQYFRYKGVRTSFFFSFCFLWIGCHMSCQAPRLHTVPLNGTVRCIAILFCTALMEVAVFLSLGVSQECFIIR